VPEEDVVHVLGNMVEAVRPGGVVLDLQLVRPVSRIESGGRVVCEVRADTLLRRVDAATAAVDSLVAEGRLVEEEVDQHQTLVHFDEGADVVAHFDDRALTSLPPEAVPLLRAIRGPCVRRDHCRLRRLRVQESAARRRTKLIQASV
jgi:hypothetical protein